MNLAVKRLGTQQRNPEFQNDDMIKLIKFVKVIKPSQNIMSL